MHASNAGSFSHTFSMNVLSGFTKFLLYKRWRMHGKKFCCFTRSYTSGIEKSLYKAEYSSIKKLQSDC